MSESSDEVVVTRDDARGRYVITVGGAPAGFTRFSPDGEGRLVFPHTVVDPAFSGRGLGSALIGQAMADVASRGETVVPVCPFVAKYLHGHEVPGLRIDWPDGEDASA